MDISIEKLQADLANAKQERAVVQSKLKDSKAKLDALKVKLEGFGITDFTESGLLAKKEELEVKIREASKKLEELRLKQNDSKDVL